MYQVCSIMSADVPLVAAQPDPLVGGTNDNGGSSLKKEFTVLSGVGFIAGNIIGSGIFITPRKIFVNTGSFGLTLVAWVIGGLIALAGGLCYIELGVVIRKSGGEYPIIRTAYSFNNKCERFGKVLAFLFLWTSVLVLRTVGAAIVLLTCAHYLSQPFYIGSQAPQSLITVLALGVLGIVTAVNLMSVQLTARVATVLSALKVIALLFVASVGIHHIANNGLTDQLHSPFTPYEGHTPSPSSIALAMYGVTFAFDGWNAMNYAIEETQNVEKTLPRSLFIAVPMVAICYLLVNIAYFAVLSYQQILSSATIGLTFGEVALGRAGLVVVPLMVALSTFGASLSSVYTGSRLMFAAARDGLFPQALSGLHRTYKTPVPAIMLQMVMMSIGVVIGDISVLLDGYSAVAFVFYGIVFAAVLVMRVTDKKSPRPFRAWFIVPVAVLSVLMSVFLVVFPVVQEPLPCLTAFAVLLSGLLVYPIMIPNTPWKKHLNTLSCRLTDFTSEYLNSEPSTL